jgi:phage terminase large subunit-like protein
MITVNANPHPGQRVVHNSPARFRVLSAGRRWGKTRLGCIECLDCAIHGGLAWWIAPTYRISQVGWKPLSRMARRIPGVEVRLADMEVRLPNGGAVGVRSADSAGGLRGEGLNFVVMDEAAFMREDAWVEEIRPALSDKLGRALFISTPKGRNWFWQAWQRGAANDPGWASFQFPTSGNPYIEPTEIEAARHDLPELVFQQEYLAEFVDMEGSVFRRIQEAATVEQIEQPQTGRQYLAGVDVAASIDYTVVTVLDVQSKHLVYMDRFNRVDYSVLEDRLYACYQRFGMQSMAVETNSIGQPVIDNLQARGMSIIPFTTTSGSKQIAITALQAAFEHGEIHIINNPVLIGELLSFEARRSPSGSFQYSAPEGMHDDCVMSLAIAWNCVGRQIDVSDLGAVSNYDNPWG